MRDSIVCGEQRAWVVAPDQICIRLVGIVDEEGLRAVLAFINAFTEGKKHLYSVCDISNLRGLTTGARRVLSEFKDPEDVITTVAWGASFTVRVLLTMLGRARQLLGLGGNTSIPNFFATEAEAHVFVEQDRRRKTPAA